MKSRTLFLSLALIFTVSTIYVLCLILCIVNMYKIRWDKIPIIGDFFLEIELWDSSFDASYLKEPIEWYQLDNEPTDWVDNGVGAWFSMNPYTKELLKKYMRENNLGIVPGDWSNFKFRSNLEECLDTFEFVELGEPLPHKNTAKYIGYAVMCVTFSLAVLFWILYFKNNPGKLQE